LSALYPGAGESIVEKGRQCLFAVLNLSVTFRGGEAMQRLRSLLVGVGSFALGVLFLSIAGTNAQQAPQYPLDDKVAREPAPWTVPGKWASAATGVDGVSRTSGGCSTPLLRR
jgi:hypothetical protein